VGFHADSKRRKNMTKAQLKEKYLEWNREIGALDDRKTEIFHTLQDMCVEKGDGHRWCSLEKLVEELVKKGCIYQVMPLISEYYMISGKHEALMSLALATDNFNI